MAMLDYRSVYIYIPGFPGFPRLKGLCFSPQKREASPQKRSEILTPRIRFQNSRSPEITDNKGAQKYIQTLNGAGLAIPTKLDSLGCKYR